VTAVDRRRSPFWLALRRCWSRWTEVLVFVKPETVVRDGNASFEQQRAGLGAAEVSGPSATLRSHSLTGVRAP